MKYYSQIILVLMSLTLSVQTASANPQSDGSRLALVHTSVTIEDYNAIESDELRISIDATGNGFVEGKVCDFCELIKVTVTPASRAYANDVEVPLKSAKSRIGRYATVIYDVKGKNVTEIRW